VIFLESKAFLLVQGIRGTGVLIYKLQGLVGFHAWRPTSESPKARAVLKKSWPTKQNSLNDYEQTLLL